jgi:hypothetical protein
MMENLDAEQAINELETQTKYAKFIENKGVLLSAKCAQFALDNIMYYEQRIKELTEEKERLKRLCELRERDHNDALDLLYKAEADTLENIKIQFAMRFGTYTDKDMTPITEVFRLLDKIAKEMIGEGK